MQYWIGMVHLEWLDVGWRKTSKYANKMHSDQAGCPQIYGNQEYGPD